MKESKSAGYVGGKSAGYVGGDVATACACAASAGCGEQATESALMERIDEVLAEYKGKPGALIPVLQIAQGIFGYLPEKVMKRIALALGKSYSEVAGVVGFYSFFSTVPRGKHLVRVCLGTACYVRGGKQVLATCRQELGVDVGGTTPDGQFTLEVARCFGACGLAPTIMIDEDVHQRVKPQKLRGIFAEYRDGRTRADSETSAGKTVVGKKADKKAAKKHARKPAPSTAKKRTHSRRERVVAR